MQYTDLETFKNQFKKYSKVLLMYLIILMTLLIIDGFTSYNGEINRLITSGELKKPLYDQFLHKLYEVSAYGMVIVFTLAVITAIMSKSIRDGLVFFLSILAICVLVSASIAGSFSSTFGLGYGSNLYIAFVFVPIVVFSAWFAYASMPLWRKKG